MEKGNTKQEILQAALDLFSAQGYDATSVSQIADAVGIRKATVYSHYAGKQDILNALLRTTLTEYERRSLFAQTDWDDPSCTGGRGDMTPEGVWEMVQGQIRYILHDPQIKKSRQMLTIEQFRNPELRALQTKRNYTDVMRYFTGMIRFLIRRGILTDGDAEIMAAQFCLPISAWIQLCDREPEREEEIVGQMHRHVHQFFALYGREPK